MAIAAEAQVPIERSVEHTRSGGLVCTHCGAELVVDERRLSITCPNGHRVEILPARTPETKRRTYAVKPCVRCQQPFQPTGGRDVRCTTCKGAAEVPSE